MVFEQSESIIEIEADRESDFHILRAEIDMIEEGKQDSVALTQNLNRRSIIKNNM